MESFLEVQLIQGEEKRRQRINGTNKSKQQNSKFNLTLPVGTLNESDLKTSIKRNHQIGCKENLIICSQEIILYIKI